MAQPKLGGKLREYRIGLVIGTRPEAIKLAPVAAALGHCGALPSLYVTGQHPGLDPADHMLGKLPATAFGCPGRNDPFHHVEEVCSALEGHWRRTAPDLVIVQGDTSSALGGARAASLCQVPLAHVEAGLRSFDSASPWPEEDFRTEIDSLANLLFAPTNGAAANLMRERCPGTLHITGNSGIDALMAQLDKMSRLRRKAKRRRSSHILVTCHRRENWGTGLTNVAAALIDLAKRGDITVEVVLHPNPQVAEAMFSLLGNQAAIRLSTPLGHSAMIDQMRRADLILSDSGGIQEEAAALGVPLLVLRASTERPECIDSGNAILVGTDRERIVATVSELFSDPVRLGAMAVPRFPFGDGRAAPQIAALSLAWLEQRADGDSRVPLSA